MCCAFLFFSFLLLAAPVILFFPKRRVLREVIYRAKVREMKTGRARRSHFHEGDCEPPRKAISMSFACDSVPVASGMMRSVLIYTPPFFTLFLQSTFSSIIGRYIDTRGTVEYRFLRISAEIYVEIRARARARAGFPGITCNFVWHIKPRHRFCYTTMLCVEQHRIFNSRRCDLR